MFIESELFYSMELYIERYIEYKSYTAVFIKN